MEQLYELYYNPKTGFLSAQKLYLKLNKQVPMKTIQDFLQKQQVHQLHQKPRSVPSFKIINVYSVNDQWQIDLIDFSKYSRWNAGFKYLFCGVDVFSRKAFVVAIKSKSDTTETMISGFKYAFLRNLSNFFLHKNEHKRPIPQRSIWHSYC
jgi:hypothetical protein